jgi:outer membrane receptor protein involved in Fe transport
MTGRERFVAAVLAFMLSIGNLEAQSLLRGRATNAVDGRPLADVLVRSVGDRTTITRTNTAGGFALEIDGFPARVVATRIGSAPETLMVRDSSGVRFRLQPAPLSLSPSLISTERSYSAASSAAIRELDIRLRPRESSQELLRLAPGLVIAQHAGGGKAEQLYLRGFDADHGTDVATSVDGIPVNMVPHAHGQGYADLHWLMPEVVESAEVRKGPFDARDGDFATAGSVSFRTVDRIQAARIATRAERSGCVRQLPSRHLGATPPKPVVSSRRRCNSATALS